ncbi:DUF6478 family protein [Jannaschia sp. S6380]|uniref:DUF6478 family protein n=1 Tax=Jannaschia sp. S6380 TaxID=2926408 RepID=UPI001FF61634|nr:DUF6478 family protein [Jannaschia sp. S6380]MCK0168668.1 DUF6478 family protein [Jannaschia sp. S6380]
MHRPPGFLESLRSRRALRAWQRAAAAGETADAETLARLAPLAREVAQRARQVAKAADRRLLGPRIGAEVMDRPAQCDWAWRPAPWARALSQATFAGAGGGTELAEGVTLFHDCPLAEITLRQDRVRDAAAAAPFALTLDALGFEGSFLSLVVNLPTGGVAGLGSGQLIGVAARLKMERPAEMFVRLNVRHGPNTEQLVSELRPHGPTGGPAKAEFDLGFVEINPARLEGAWIDIIFEKPEMNLVRIEDLTLTRRPRADI